VGGELLATGTSAAWADGDWLVVEADESDRSFLELEPEIAVVTNVEVDHFREYGSHHELEEAFRVFLAGADQAVIWDRPELLGLREGSVVAFEVADIDLATGGSRFGWRGHDVALPVAGTHNARNAAAALEACRLAGADLDLAVAALANYRGASRRFELVGETSAGASVYDDYAVHPTAIRATLDAARTLEPTRLVAVLQPFGHHRVRNMADAFRDAIAQADLALILDIYSPRPPGEEDRGVSSDWISGSELIRVPDIDAARGYLENELRAGDLCVTLGGDEMGELARRLVG
jgi:UDP-N-acetylmuramate--alanine ligase